MYDVELQTAVASVEASHLGSLYAKEHMAMSATDAARKAPKPWMTCSKLIV